MDKERLVSLMDADRSKIERVGVSASKAFGTRARISAIRVWSSTHHIPSVIKSIQNEFLFRQGQSYVDLVAAGMANAHLAGVYRTHKVLANAASRNGSLSLSIGSVFSKSVNFFKKKIGMTAQTIHELTSRFGEVASQVVIKQTKFVTDKIANALQISIEEGDGVKEGVDRLRKAFDAAGIVPGSEATLETTFRTQTQLAYSAGRLDSLADVGDLLWGFEYVTVGDDRVRPRHAMMDGVIRPKEDPIWQMWHPPCGWNCRCSTLEILDKGMPTDVPADAYNGPDPGFGFNPADLVKDINGASGS